MPSSAMSSWVPRCWLTASSPRLSIVHRHPSLSPLPRCPTPIVEAVTFTFEVRSAQGQACAHATCAQALSAGHTHTHTHTLAVRHLVQDPQLQPALLTVQPFVVRRTARREGLVRVCVTLHLHQAADEDSVQLSYTAQLQAALAPSASRREELHEFVTQVVDYSALGTVGADVAELTVAPTAAGAAAEPAQQSKRQRVE